MKWLNDEIIKWWDVETNPKWWNGYIVISFDIILLYQTCNTAQNFTSLDAWEILRDMIFHIVMLWRIRFKVLLNKQFNCFRQIRNNRTVLIKSGRPWISSIICLNRCVLEMDNSNSTLQVLTTTKGRKTIYTLQVKTTIKMMFVLNLVYQEFNN